MSTEYIQVLDNAGATAFLAPLKNAAQRMMRRMRFLSVLRDVARKMMRQLCSNPADVRWAFEYSNMQRCDCGIPGCSGLMRYRLEVEHCQPDGKPLAAPRKSEA